MEIQTLANLQGYKRPVKAVVIDIAWKDAVHQWGTGKGVKAFSWWVLEQCKSIAAKTQGGDSAANNFALNTFEQALDWEIGLAVLHFMQGLIRRKQRANFRIAIVKNNTKTDRKSVFIQRQTKNGEWVTLAPKEDIHA